MLNQQIAALRKQGIYPAFQTLPKVIRCTLHSAKLARFPWGEGVTLEDALAAALADLARV